MSPPDFSEYRKYEDAISGVLLIAVAVLALWVSRGYPVGSAANMGPGYFPRLVCWIIVALGVMLVVKNFQPIDEADLSVETLKFRPLLSIAGSGIIFGLTLHSVGLLPAVLLLILVAAVAVPRRNLVEVIAMIVVLEAMTFGMWALVQTPVPLFGSN
jgi:putative tricarboxylic transport membrane protein